MVQQETILRVIETQRGKIEAASGSLKRELLPALPNLNTHALIISGIRRCGKSTLLLQILMQKHKKALYLNFEDPRLFGFKLADFQLLDAIIAKTNVKHLFFDEIQIINGWERYIRQKLDEGYKIVITGSNASMLSRELGTKLTGRHISKELFPFSYTEFLLFNSLKASADSWQKYAKTGGFPEYVKIGNSDILVALFSDILNRDIAVRHGIRDVLSLERLAVYLVSNAGGLVSARKLLQPLGFQSSTTILEYFSFLEDCYLVNFMPKFSYSPKVQAINPKKIFVIDPGILSIASQSFSPNKGHSLENLIYWHFRRQGKELFYFQEKKGECDFVVFKNNKFELAIQVCYELTPENSSREINGLNEALDFFGSNNGVILTFNQRDVYIRNGKRIEIKPVWEFISTN
ncbi:MAG: ATP-binding protein [Fibromonadaceae bacterium]|jgi:predicted AAA+ superfamily ATPase|nr:ATP-binding protein [Fibromonadaceae bacterium]